MPGVALRPDFAKGFRLQVQAARAASAENAAAEHVFEAGPMPSAVTQHALRGVGPEFSSALLPRPVRAEVSPAPPSVQVTIGRVEVRAILTPPVPPQRRPPARPRLSLDEYLRQRHSSRR
jgi:hypothetical protein